MKIEVKDVSPVRKSLSVEADVAEVSRETEDVVRRYARQVRVPGFRQGRVPEEIVRRRFAKEIQEDVRERMVTRLYTEATREKGLRPVGDPILEELVHEEGQPFRIRTTFEVLPVLEVKAYKGIEVREAAAHVAPTDVDDALESLRHSHARYVADENRAAAAGDLIVADVEETPDGGDPIRRERAVLEVGSSDLLAEFNGAIEGTVRNADLDFAVSYPEGHPAGRLAGKNVRYVLHVHEVKRREIPSLDDEFARDVGDFEGLEALRQRISDDLLERKKAEAQRSVRQAVLDKVLIENPVPLPETLVDEEVRHRLEDMARAMILHGMDPRNAEIDWKQLRDRQVDAARKTVHAQLVLDAVAAAEGLEVDRSEVDGRIRAEAERLGESFEDLRSRLVKKGGLEPLRNQLLREKSLDFLTSVANIQRAE